MAADLTSVAGIDNTASIITDFKEPLPPIEWVQDFLSSSLP